MIRDPSDGSVREPRSAEDASKMRAPAIGPALALASGLPAGSTKPEQIARLEESRRWVRDYHAKKSNAKQD